MIAVHTRIPDRPEELESALADLAALRRDLDRHGRLLLRALESHHRATPAQRMALLVRDLWLDSEEVTDEQRRTGVMLWNLEVNDGLHDWDGTRHQEFLALAREVLLRSSPVEDAILGTIREVLRESLGQNG